jgi:Tfp pilus assembly protein PilF
MCSIALRILTLSAALAAFSGTSCIAAPAAPPLANAPGGGPSAYADVRFTRPLGAGLRHFYARDFSAAQGDFEQALAVIPDNTFALAFLDAAAAQQPGALDALTNATEDAVSAAPKEYARHVKLGFAYIFASLAGRDRLADARDEFGAARALAPGRPAAHVGLGILRFDDRSANRAKNEFLAAVSGAPDDVLALEYLAQLYQSDLHDPRRALTYAIEASNLVPDYADIHFHIGSLLHDLKEPEAALKEIDRALTLDPGRVGEAQHGYTLMARIYLERHDLDAAKSALDRSIAAGVDTIVARHLLDKIARGDYSAPKAKS